MATVKVKVDVLNEMFDIKQSSRNEIKVLEIQAKISDLEADMNEMSDKEQAKAAIKLYNLPINFLVDLLGLDEDQEDILWDQSLVENMDLFGRVAGRLMGISEDELSKGLPKKQIRMKQASIMPIKLLKLS